jgi:uncharacterized glyoxalase superfamily protein PhnB
MQAITPMLTYEDGVAAMAWLARAFGFTERMRMVEEDGSLGHGELQAGEGVVMLAGPPGYTSPLRHRETCETERRAYDNPWAIDGVLVTVQNVDEHCARAQAAGARVVRGPETTEHGRLYTAEDIEGHRWMFVQES